MRADRLMLLVVVAVLALVPAIAYAKEDENEFYARDFSSTVNSVLSDLVEGLASIFIAIIVIAMIIVIGVPVAIVLICCCIGGCVMAGASSTKKNTTKAGTIVSPAPDTQPVITPVEPSAAYVPPTSTESVTIGIDEPAPLDPNTVPLNPVP